MRIVNGKKFYATEIKNCVRIDNKGWNHYNGRNYQWYTLKYNPDCGLVILDADNSGDCYGDYGTYYFASPREFVNEYGIDKVGRLLGDVDEDNKAAMHFINALNLPASKKA